MSEEFRPVVGYEELYEISLDGRLFAIERKIFQDDEVGRRFHKTIEAWPLETRDPVSSPSGSDK